jgi:hypothetical protein
MIGIGIGVIVANILFFVLAVAFVAVIARIAFRINAQVRNQQMTIMILLKILEKKPGVTAEEIREIKSRCGIKFNNF